MHDNVSCWWFNLWCSHGKSLTVDLYVKVYEISKQSRTDSWNSMWNTAALGLFDTLVPIASIVTISVLVVYILPKQEHFGLFLLIWWAMSVFLSLRNNFFGAVGEWSRNDGIGMVVLLGFAALVQAVLYIWFRTQPNLRVFLYKKVPLWSLFALHVYRLDGLSIIVPFGRGDVPKYLGLQMILLDVLIGATSIPLTWLVYTKGADALVSGWRRDLVGFWNSLGLYDLTSAYIVLIMNFWHIGGHYVTEPALSVVGFHPIPLILLFQAPLAIASHVVLLTSLDTIIEKQTTGLPLHIQRIRRSEN